MHQADGVGVVEDGADEAGCAPEGGGLGGDRGDHVRRRVQGAVPPALGDAGPAGVGRVRVDEGERSRTGGDVGATVVEDLDAVGDGRDHEVLVGVPDEGLADVPGTQQVDPGQLRVPPVPCPLR